ncbi:MAG TPA: cupin domain-containing protein [Rhodanobacteraceae bacterium]|nr:cupin domain-containing protein [Rhodanobacteraceae bacterium]
MRDMNPPPIETRATPRQMLGMPAARFLSVYWQKHPLLIRAAFPDFQPPISPDELAGLALEEAALARLIVHDRQRDQWRVKSAPLAEADFTSTPPADWTLLVQDVDKWDADVAALLAHFRFLPSWRIDDVMISYAENGGGVGAHVDQYDVFLLQGLGRRHWHIDARPNPPLAFRPDVELKQLADFTPSHRWTLEPGDMLYLPPGVPHDGIADGDCMTISVGMRAPSAAELLLDLSEHLAEFLPESQRYADPDLAPAGRAGEIDAAALTRAAAALGPLAGALDRHAFADWFGRFITRYRSAQFAAAPPRPPGATALERALAKGARFSRHPWSRCAWHARGRGAMLYVAGEAWPCSAALARTLCAERDFTLDDSITPGDRQTVLGLLAGGHLLLRKNR